MTRKAFVIGHPIAHSRSPLIHGKWLAEYAIDGSYEPFDVAPDALPKFFQRLRDGEFVGGNVTIPHKEAVFALCDAVDPLAETIGAVNTLVRQPDGTVHGTNTDYLGFLGNLDANAPGWSDGLETAIVLGAGGAARAILVALRRRGIKRIHVLNRTIATAERLVGEIEGAFVAGGLDSFDGLAPEAGLVVNTTSVGMHGTRFEAFDLSLLPAGATVTDLVYVPRVTPLLCDAERLGLRTVDGLGMLLHQAVPGFSAWFGITPEVTGDLRRRVELTLGARAMLRIGLTGSIATGKSSLLKAFEELGARTFSADAAVHELYAGPAVAAVTDLFAGVAPEGYVDRSLLSAALAGYPDRFAALEAVVHPLVRERITAFMDEAERDGATIAVVEVPLLFESGHDYGFDLSAITWCPEPILRERAMRRAGMTVEKLDAILARQMPQAEKRKRADHVFDTSGTIEDTRAQIRAFVDGLEANGAQQ